jgi:hypothetical protein
MPNMDGFRNRAEDGKVAAGIDQPACLIVLLQNIDRAIDGKTFGYTAEIDPYSRMMEPNAISRRQLDGLTGRRRGLRAADISFVTRQQPKFLQYRSDSDVENTF